jgi:hypothetical protein
MGERTPSGLHENLQAFRDEVNRRFTECAEKSRRLRGEVAP